MWDRDGVLRRDGIDVESNSEKRKVSIVWVHGESSRMRILAGLAVLGLFLWFGVMVEMGHNDQLRRIR